MGSPEMALVFLEKNDCWPHYEMTANDHYNPGFEVDDADLRRWRRARDTYFAVQKELAAIYEAWNDGLRRADVNHD